MRLKLRLLGAPGSARGVVVTVDAVATVGDVASALIERDPTGSLEAVVEPTLSVGFPGATAVVLDPGVPVTEARIASGADIRVVSGQRQADESRSPVLAVLRVETGPSAGREFEVGAGSFFIGRDASSNFVIDDPRVSKRHARVEVTRGIDFVDLNSANGMVVDGGEVGRVSIATGQSVRLGDSVIRGELVGQDPSSHAQRGPVEFNRGPRVEERYSRQSWNAPEVPRAAEPVAFPWVALIAPLALGAVMLVAMKGNPLTVAVIAVSPLLMLGTFVTHRLKGRALLRARIAEFARRIAALQVTMDREAQRERTVRLQEAASTGQVIAEAGRLGSLLWTRRPEHWNFLNVRLGIGTALSRSTIVGRDDSSGIPEFARQLDAIVEACATISGVPIVDNAIGAGALGVAGSITASTEAANSVLAQLAGLHSPHELSVTAIVGPAWSAGFEWLTWLPHTGAANAPVRGTQLGSAAASGTAVLAGLEELIEQRTHTARSGQLRGPIGIDDSVMIKGAAIGDGTGTNEAIARATPCVVVLISDDAPVNRGRLVAMIERAADAGIVPIWVAQSRASLPAACRTFVELAPSGQLATVGFVRAGQQLESIAVESLASEDALAFARRLASVSDAGAAIADDSDIPQAVAFVDLLGAEMAVSPEAVIDRWQQNASIHDRTPGAVPRTRAAGRLRALVGQSATEAMHLDLRTQGPHALVGGTTGAGKSEFLQAWVLGMAAEYSPDRVSFLLVDYKGGAAFADCVNLPHTVGLVTDLSPHLVRRALTSLRAELRHREHLLNRKKAKDLIELEKRGDPESPPALVLVIDEFAALASEIPEFVDGVVDVAQRGRSLGIHLIMATQRPAGVIKDNLRANTNLRIALRMADEADSTDVIGSQVAASFDPSVPGRAVAKTGPGRVAAFQAGYTGGWTVDTPAVPSIEIADLVVGAARVWERPVAEIEAEQSDAGPNDAARLVSTFTQAAEAAGIPAPRRPWLDELDSVYDVALLDDGSDERLLIGLADDPAGQSQHPVYFRPDVDGNLAVYGTGGTGKSTTLRTIAAVAGATPNAAPVHVYCLDFGSGALRMLESLPHVGSVISGDDTERIGRLLAMLRQTVAERAERYAAARAGTIAEYRALAHRPLEPRILLLVDGMAVFRQEYEFGGTAAFTLFQQLLADGRQVGVHAVVSADRPSSISPSVAAAIQRRIVLRLAADGDYGLIGAPADMLSPASPAGRAVLDQLETQIAVFGGTASVAEQSAAIERLGAAMRDRGVAEAPPVERLAEEVPLASILGAAPGSLMLGIADDDLAPVGIEPIGAFLLAGPPSSGRSTALQTIVASLAASHPAARRYYFGGTHSPLGGMPGWEGIARGVDAASSVARDLLAAASEPATDTTRLVIVIESLSEFVNTGADAHLVALVKAARRNRHFVVGESESSTWSQLWPLLAEFKSARRGFVLQPDGVEGEILFKTSFGRIKGAEFPPGRGMLVQGGSSRRVQFALEGGAAS